MVGANFPFLLYETDVAILRLLHYHAACHELKQVIYTTGYKNQNSPTDGASSCNETIPGHKS